jgi:hypothetical protein
MNEKNKKNILLLAAVVGAIALAGGIFSNGQQIALALEAASGSSSASKWYTDEFFLEDCEFSTTGSNRYFILEPGFRSIFKGEGDEGEKIELVIKVLDKTKVVDGVKTRIVEERESINGELFEDSRNYFAICEQTNSVFYFGENVDFYEDGKIVSHNGTWLAGKNGAEPGLQMPSTVLLGAKYMQEVAPGVALDRAQIISIDKEVDTPAGDFEDVLKVKETTPLEPDNVEFKYYAAGVGLISDGELELVKYGFK